MEDEARDMRSMRDRIREMVAQIDHINPRLVALAWQNFLKVLIAEPAKEKNLVPRLLAELGRYAQEPASNDFAHLDRHDQYPLMSENGDPTIFQSTARAELEQYLTHGELTPELTRKYGLFHLDKNHEVYIHTMRDIQNLFTAIEAKLKNTHPDNTPMLRNLQERLFNIQTELEKIEEIPTQLDRQDFIQTVLETLATIEQEIETY